MRKLSISIFSRAADAHATRQSLTFEELIEDFRAPEICEDSATESAAVALKLEAPAWSSSLYQNDHRSKEDFTSASCLVYDLDGLDKQGVLAQPILDRVRKLQIAYCAHSTTRSGFCTDGRVKLRLIFPLAKDFNAAEYDSLWAKISSDLQLDPDSTRRHPSGLYFAPVVFAEHLSSYLFECQLEGPYLGAVFSKTLARHDEKYWLDSIRNATQKHEALNKAAYALGKLGAKDAVEKCLAALLENVVSSPVEDWGAARHTAQKAVEDSGNEDPLEVQKGETEKLISPALAKTAEAKLRQCQRAVTAGGSVGTAAREMGRFVPHGIDAETVTRTLLLGWDKCQNKTQSKPEAETEISTGIGAGGANPVGVYEAWKNELFMNQDGTGFAPTESNTQLLISNHPELDGLVSHDVRQDSAIYRKEAPWGGVPGLRVADADKLVFGPWCARELGVSNVSSHVAFEALLAKAQTNPYDVLLEYFASLPAITGTDVLDRVFIDSAGAEDSEYTRLAARYWFISVYARQLVPGCQADHALVLSGKQGVGKSTFFASIFPANIRPLCATSVIPDWDDKDCKIALSKFAVVELSELDQMSKATVEGVKKFLTETRADVRPAYGRVSQSYPRRAVFGGTTNKEADFLVDATGNRRFWPIAVGEFDTTWNDRYRDILWAQARYAYEATQRWWPKEEEKALFEAAQLPVVALETFHEDLLAILERPVSSRQWKTKGSPPSQDGMSVLLEGQALGQILPFVTTKQLATLLDLDHNNTTHVGRLKRALALAGWRERRAIVEGVQGRVWKKS